MSAIFVRDVACIFRLSSFPCKAFRTCASSGGHLPGAFLGSCCALYSHRVVVVVKTLEQEKVDLEGRGSGGRAIVRIWSMTAPDPGKNIDIHEKFLKLSYIIAVLQYT